MIPKILNPNILRFLKHLNIYYFNLFYLKGALEFILNLFEIMDKKYNIKQILPQKFITMFFIGIQKEINDSKPILIMSRESLKIIQSHSYLDHEFFSEILSYISQSYSYTGIYISLIDKDIDKIELETISLHQIMNNDNNLKTLFLKLNKAYDECILQIATKENEITQDDFDDL